MAAILRALHVGVAAICACALVACAQPLPEQAQSASYVKATATGPRTFRVVLRAPQEHPLYLENCNGTINWGLTAAPADARPAWSVMRNQCLSPPVFVAAGAAQTFTFTIARDDDTAPKPGEYRVVLMGVFKNWTSDSPLRQPQVDRSRLISEPVPLAS